MVVGVKPGKCKAKVRLVRHQYFINIVAVGIPVLKHIRIISVAEHLPVVVVIIPAGIIGVNKVFFLNPSTQGIITKFSYIGAVLGYFDYPVLIVVLVPGAKGMVAVPYYLCDFGVRVS